MGDISVAIMYHLFFIFRIYLRLVRASTHVLIGHLPVGPLPVWHHFPEQDAIAPGITGGCKLPVGYGLRCRPPDRDLTALTGGGGRRDSVSNSCQSVCGIHSIYGSLHKQHVSTMRAKFTLVNTMLPSPYITFLMLLYTFSLSSALFPFLFPDSILAHGP